MQRVSAACLGLVMLALALRRPAKVHVQMDSGIQVAADHLDKVA